ncbi:Tfp pilus assembly protein pilus retraction ATPase PilT-like protein [Fibrobacter succinogenes subsp. succinogenes S85]|uniref:Tfp pilus assembly protein pilus retraction ATPase PilT-like protein n=1 Tax=Fibrobacter succinogenes (strain ATCC 19169 / S85) TaxID=59374 RepID=A0ABM5LGF3_FIBSS|nr:ATPase, T2SS/T4P/T4SS family [Fibrobacter succinogenes]ACX74622.1 Tfp pilus assembly protein pilus retraction ATPase PilT-like protein [Fibrobacter succinogenes subsp. succinogenes S85]
MRNQYMAKVLVHNKVVSEDQVKAHWGEISDSMDIGQVLVRAGILKQSMYDKVLAFVKNLEAKNAKPASKPAEKPAAASSAAPAPSASTPAQSSASAHPTAPAQPAPAAVSAAPAPQPEEEPAIKIEGNSSLYGEASSSTVVIEKVEGLETTSMASVQVPVESETPAEETATEELPSQFAVATGEGEAVEAPDVLHPITPLAKIIAYARKFNVTDVYLYADRQITMRQSGKLFIASEKVLEKTHLMDRLAEAAEGFADGYKIVVGRNFSKTMGLPGVGRARISVTWNDVTPSISIRIIPMESVALENLYLPEFSMQFATLNSGLVLIAGPSSSGRSTTMTAFAECIAANRQVFIQTVEKPIERLLQNPNGSIAQREVGLHVRSGAAGIELAIRTGADVILFDHLETMEELSLLMQASNAGALVFAVASGNNINALLSRLLMSVPSENRAAFACSLAEQLKGVIVQHLIPAVQNQGLVLATEAMKVTSTIAGMIRKCDVSQILSAISNQKDQGITLDDSLQMCVESGYIEGNEAWKRANDSRRFASYRKV